MAKMNNFRDILDNTVLLPMLRTGLLSGIFYLMDPLANMINYKATTVIVWEIYGSKNKKNHQKQPELGYFRGILDNTALLPMHRTRFRIGIFILKHPQAEIINYMAAPVVVWILYGSKTSNLCKNRNDN